MENITERFKPLLAHCTVVNGSTLDKKASSVSIGCSCHSIPFTTNIYHYAGNELEILFPKNWALRGTDEQNLYCDHSIGDRLMRQAGQKEVTVASRMGQCLYSPIKTSNANVPD